LAFFLFGESYAGHYVPALAARIADGNQARGAKINLQGIAIGNGWVDPETQYGAYADFLYDNNLIDDASKTLYDYTLLPACEALIVSRLWPLAVEECSLAMESALLDAEAQAGHTINVYDIRRKCDVEPLCYDFALADKFLSQPDVISALHVGSHEWTDCSVEVHTLLLDDWVESFKFDIPTLLASGIRVLVYSGMEDFICNYYGGRDWVASMLWPGQDEYTKAPFQNWTVNGQIAGYSKSAQGLTFLEVANAGHMVPMDQPLNALDMVKHMIKNVPF